MTDIDRLAELYELEPESKVINQDKGKEKKVINLNNEEEIKKAEFVIERVKEGNSEKEVFYSLIPSLL